MSLVVDRYAAKATTIRAQVRSAATVCGGNWKQLLALTVGGDTGFFEPLTRGIGAAVRAGASAAEIEGFVAALLAQRADPGRRRQYGPRGSAGASAASAGATTPPAPPGWTTSRRSHDDMNDAPHRHGQGVDEEALRAARRGARPRRRDRAPRQRAAGAGPPVPQRA